MTDIKRIATGSSSNLISVAIGEPFHQHGALDATDHEAEASQLPSMIEGVTYQSLETIYQQPVYYTPVFDSNSFFLGMTPVFEPALFEQAPSPFDQGPFLSTVQPLSPTETYSAEPTPESLLSSKQAKTPTAFLLRPAVRVPAELSLLPTSLLATSPHQPIRPPHRQWIPLVSLQ